jgi:hypothetical protein
MSNPDIDIVVPPPADRPIEAIPTLPADPVAVTPEPVAPPSGPPTIEPTSVQPPLEEPLVN